MEDRIKALEQEISLIKDRNIKVEADKAWETSTFRVISILIATYIFASLALYFIGIENYLVSAFIPVLGYFLSVQSLPFIKKWWIKKNEKI
jgi:hypothetical protein